MCLLLLPRLGLWSRDKAAKGTAEVASSVAGRIDEATNEVEAVGVASARVGPRRPAVAVLASVVKLISVVWIDIPAPHKEEWALWLVLLFWVDKRVRVLI